MLRSGWRISSRCAGGDCIAVKSDGAQILIRDSKDPDGPVLVFTRDEWIAFLDGAKAGEFDV
ncbi:MAG: DUF397 domain-containing protein [Catenulispora sp.]|jgi:hypothetical protein